MMEVCWVSEEVTPMEDARYASEPGWMDSIRAKAARTLAAMILRDNKALYRRIEPTKEQLQRNPCAPIKHQFSIGLESSLTELAAREAQIEQGRQAGRAEAAALCLAAARQYRNSDGGCGWVIASALEDAAKAIQQS